MPPSEKHGWLTLRLEKTSTTKRITTISFDQQRKKYARKYPATRIICTTQQRAATQGNAQESCLRVLDKQLFNIIVREK